MMTNNISPIDITFLKEETIQFLPDASLQSFAKKTIRARDFIRTHWNCLHNRNPILASKLRDIFCSPAVSEIMDFIETQPISNELQRRDTEEILRCVAFAAHGIDRYTDPFTLIPFI